MSLGKRKENSMKLILDKKINKTKELWKTLKSMGLSSKAVIASNICLKDKNKIVFNATKNCSIFNFLKFLHKIWYLSYPLHLIFLLNLKLHHTMTITQCQKI